MDVLGEDVDMVEQLFMNAEVAALLMVGGDGVEFVKAHYCHILEAYLTSFVSFY